MATSKKASAQAEPAPLPEGVPAIYPSMARIMQEIEAIGKEKTNEQQGFKYRGIDDAYNMLHPILARNSVFVVPRGLGVLNRSSVPTRSGGNLNFTMIAVEYDFISGIDGSKVTVGPIYGEGMDAADKSTSKAHAISQKYSLLMTFLIPTNDMTDPDATSYADDVVYGQPPQARAMGVAVGAVDAWGEPLSSPPPVQPPVPSSQQPAAPPPPPRRPPAQAPRQDVPQINDAQGAKEVADMLINMAEASASSSKSALIGFWKKNKQVIDLLDTDWNDEYQRVKEAFTGLRNQIEGANQ